MVYDERGPETGEEESRVQIGGDEDCEHESLRRVGSDGGYNIYFECTDCSAVTVKFSETADEGGDRHNELAEEDLPEDPPTGNKQTHPLIKGLTPDSNGQSDGEGPIEKLKSSLRGLFGDRKR